MTPLSPEHFDTVILGRGAGGKLRDAILAHPTMAEGLGALFANVPPLPAG